MQRIFVKFCLYIISFSVLFSCKNEKTNQNKGQNTEGVVSPIETAFINRFPQAQDVYWDTLDIGYSVTFNDGKFDCKAIFDAKGNYQYRTKIIEMEALPASVKKFLNTKYKDSEIAILQLVDYDTKQTYQVELQSDTDYITLEFDTSGKLIKETRDPLSGKELQEQEEEGVEKKDNE